jgi:hypothetical protein
MMIVAVCALVAAFVASLTVTARGKDKNAAAVPAQAIKHSPKKKNLGGVIIKQEDINQSKAKIRYYLKIIKLKPDIEVIWIDSTPGNDGYGQHLFNHIKNENGFREFGTFVLARRRVNQATNEELNNARDDWSRRCIVRILDEPSSHDSRLAVLSAFQLYLQQPLFNKYDTHYSVGRESDLTPENEADLVAMDHFLLDNVIVNIMTTVYEGTDTNWYSHNVDSALDFFSGPLFPACAVQALGYPSIAADNPGFAPGFNPPM